MLLILIILLVLTSLMISKNYKENYFFKLLKSFQGWIIIVTVIASMLVLGIIGSQHLNVLILPFLLLIGYGLFNIKRNKKIH